MASRTLVIKTKMDNTEFIKQIKEVEGEIADIQTLLEQNQKEEILSSAELKEEEAKLEKLTNKLVKLKQKQAELDNQGGENYNQMLSNINNSMTKTIKSVGKWALALLSIRSIYGFISSAMSTATQYNEQLGNDLDYIKFSIAQALMPLLEKCVIIIYKLLGLVNAISKALFNYDLFTNATAENFNKANKNAKQLKNTLAGFDEMNVLTDTSSTDTSSATMTPSLDLSKATDEMDDFMKDTKATFKKTSKDIGKTLSDKSLYEQAYGNWGDMVYGVASMTKGLDDIFIGTGETLKGIVKMVKGVIHNDTKEMADGIKLTCKGIWDFILGIGESITGLFITVVGSLRGITSDLKDYIEKNFIDDMEKKLGKFGTFIGSTFGAMITNITTQIDDCLKGLVRMGQGIMLFFDGKFKEGMRQIMGGLLDIMLAPINGLRSAINMLIDGLNKINIKIPNNKFFGDLAGSTVGVNIPHIPELPKLAKGGIVNNPSHGVNMGSYIAGEKGPEAVLPLNEETLEQLGQALGRYINLNANIPVYVGNRLVTREQRKIETQSDFAYNR